MKHSKFLSVFFTTVILTGLLIFGAVSANAAWDGTAASGFGGGSGTSASPYLIKNEKQLAYLNQMLDTLDFDGAYFRLDRDLDMTGAVWNAKGTFSGFFNGNGYSITLGSTLFNNIGADGTVDRLTVKRAESAALPMLCMKNYGHIQNCIVRGDSNGNGLLCTTNENGGVVQNSAGFGSVYDPDLSGWIRTNKGTVNNCYTDLALSTSSGGRYEAAGKKHPIAAGGTGTITNCYCTNSGFSYVTVVAKENMKSPGFVDMLNKTNTLPGYTWAADTSNVNDGYPVIATCLAAKTSLAYTSESEFLYHTGTITTSITCSLSGCTVYYTLDGSDPITSGTRRAYSSALTLSGDFVVRSVAYKNGEYSGVYTQKGCYLPGSGTAAAPYRITEKQQLLYMAKIPDAWYRLDADLTFTADDFTPDGLLPNGWIPIDEFSGSLDGQGHFISGLQGSHGGLVHKNRGTIRNIRLLHHLLYNDTGTFGAIADYNYATLTCCYAASDFSLDTLPAVKSCTVAGGIVGYTQAELKYCRNGGVVGLNNTAKDVWLYVGGIAGEGSNIYSCINDGQIIMKSSAAISYGHLGGMGGANDVYDCRNNGSSYINAPTNYYNVVNVGGTRHNYSEISGYRIYDATSAAQYISSRNYSCRENLYKQTNTAADLDMDTFSSYDFAETWVMTEEGPVPIGVMCADGSITQKDHASYLPLQSSNGYLYVNKVKKSPTDEGYVLDEGNYYLSEDITLSSSLVIAGDAKLCLNGKVLRYDNPAEQHAVIVLNSNTNLEITDCNHKAEHKFSVQNDDKWVLNESSGTETLLGGCITGGTGMVTSSTSQGGGIFIRSGASLHMHGGNIVGNSASGTIYSGAGIFIDSYHYSYDASQGSIGTAVLEKRVGIYGNIANGRGGGICNYEGKLTVNGAKISNNAAYDGGGIAVIGPYAIVSANDAVISGNRSKGWGGGGIYTEGKSDIFLDSCTITKNQGSHGGGIYVYTTASSETADQGIHVTVSGNCRILDNTGFGTTEPNNVYLLMWQSLHIGDSGLSEKALIGITKSDSYRSLIATSDKAAAANFISDSDSYHIVKNDSGEIHLKAHSFDEETILTEATCQQAGLKKVKCVCGAETTEDIPALGHDYGESTYEWKQVGDDWQCTAKRVCSHDESHIETETVGGAYNVMTQPNCTDNGSGRYTATFTNEAFDTKTMDVSIPALGHSYGDWARADDFSVSGIETRECPVCHYKETRTLSGITLSTLPTVTEYLEAKDAFDPAGGKLTLSYDNADTEAVDLAADMITGFDNTEVGEQTLTVSCGGKSTTFSVTIVVKTLSGIAITTAPAKTVYIEGDSFDPTGMVVTAYYDNDTSEPVTAYTYAPTNELAAADTKITVTYSGKTAEQAITVTAKQLTGIEVYPAHTAYILNTPNPDVAGGKLRLIYDNGSEELIDLTESMITGFDGSKAGEQVLTVSYHGLTVQYKITVGNTAAGKLGDLCTWSYDEEVRTITLQSSEALPSGWSVIIARYDSAGRCAGVSRTLTEQPIALSGEYSVIFLFLVDAAFVPQARNVMISIP